MVNKTIVPFIVPIKDLKGRIKGGLEMLVEYETSECEQLYTLAEAEKIIDHNRSKARQKRRTERIYYIKQRLSGVAMLTIGIITLFLLDGDATFFLLIAPIGIGLIITKQKVMMFRR